jgi:ubiquinone/menaquinone biosynthesis C-methylase UbiE
VKNVPPYLGLYRRLLRELIDTRVLDTAMTVLVVCGGESDWQVLRELGFTNVTISNLDTRMTGSEFAPYQWARQDAEALTCADESYDVVIVCAGLHHCPSPHRALLEMYRVARRCAIALEARDGFLSRIAVRLGVVDEYELTAVVGNDYRFGGVRNTSLPNYIYRWTEREVVKTIASYAPHAPPRIRWFHEFAPPVENLKGRRSLRGLLLLRLAYPALWLVTRLFPGQCNLFAFAVLKPAVPRDLFPWVKAESGELKLHREWVEQNFLKGQI